MPPNILITEGYFNLGFPSPPAALPPPPPAPEIKPPGPRSRGFPPGPPARVQGCRVHAAFRVEQNSLDTNRDVWVTCSGGRRPRPGRPFLCAPGWQSPRSVVECVGVHLAGVVRVLSVLCDCCLCPQSVTTGAWRASRVAGPRPGWRHGCICSSVLQTSGDARVVA